MNNLDQLQKLYEDFLKTKLTDLEVLRKFILRFYIYAALEFVLGASVFIILFANDYISDTFIIVGLIAVLIGGLLFLIQSITKQREYRKRFKIEVVSEIVHAINPDWTYAYQESIEVIEYYQSNLFPQGIDRYKGDDLIYGQIEKTDFRCSELHTEYKTVTHTKNGGTQEHWHTIFKGLFFHADFNKEIKAETYIAPDYAEKLLGKWGKKFQISSKGKLVTLENPEFEKKFVVHSTDQIEARYILTPTIMEALVKIHNQYQQPMHLSFIGSRIFCAVSFNQDLFEPNIMRTGVSFKEVAFMYDLFMLNAVIIKELNLNTRIWTKN